MEKNAVIWLAISVVPVLVLLLRLRNLHLRNRKLTLEITKLTLEMTKLNSIKKRRDLVDTGRQKLRRLAAASPEGSLVRQVLALSMGPQDPNAHTTPNASDSAREGWKRALREDSADDALWLAMSPDTRMSALGFVQLRSLGGAGNKRAEQYMRAIEAMMRSG